MTAPSQLPIGYFEPQPAESGGIWSPRSLKKGRFPTFSRKTEIAQKNKMAPSVLVDQASQVARTQSLVGDPTSLKVSHPNPSLQVTADHKLKTVNVPVYAPRAGEALVHIKATGICGSDLHFWKTGRIGSLVFEGDCIIGHEASGIVLQCGEGVDHLKPGMSDKTLCWSLTPLANISAR
jgi:hypothetical protein